MKGPMHLLASDELERATIARSDEGSGVSDQPERECCGIIRPVGQEDVP